MQIQLYPERCEFRRRATIVRLRDSLVMKLETSPRTAVVVASHAGTQQIRVENPRMSHFPEWDDDQLVASDGAIDMSSADASIHVTAGTTRADNRLTWEAIPCMPLAIHPVPQAHRTTCATTIFR